MGFSARTVGNYPLYRNRQQAMVYYEVV